MSVKKRVYPDGRTVWRARAWTYPPHGERREVAKNFDTRKAAEAWEREQRQTAHGRTVDLERLTLADSGLWSRAEPVLRSRLAPKTFDHYRRGWQARVLPTLGAIKVGALTVGDVERAQATWAAAGAGPSTVRQARLALSAVLAVAVADGLLPANPARDARRPAGDARSTRRVGRTMTPQLIAVLVDAIRDIAGVRYALMVDLMGSAGLRYGETAGLQIGDLDFGRGVVTVDRQVTEVALDAAETVLPAGRRRDGNLVWGPPKSGRARNVPLPQHLVELLQQLTAGRPGTALVFESERGRRGVVRSNVLRRKTGWTSLVARLGYPGFRIHDLRASAATNYLAAGVPVDVVRDVLGHHDLAVTNLYARPHDGALNLAAAALARYSGL